jgi:RNA polymerase primary sigma factor
MEKPNDASRRPRGSKKRSRRVEESPDRTELSQIVSLESLVDRAKRADKQESYHFKRSSYARSADPGLADRVSHEDDWDDPFLQSIEAFDPAEAQSEPDPDIRDIPEEIDPNDPVSLYFREVSKVPLLSHEEEITLAKRIEAGRKASAMLASGSFPQKERAELQRLVEDGWAAREHLITANFRLVISVAKKYIGRGLPFLDLIQDGNIGLIRATKKFEYRRGYRFSTYATWWIRQAVSRAVADHGRTIRLPVHMGDQINRLHRISHRLIQKFGREPTPPELSKALDMPLEKVEELLEIDQRPLSLEYPADEDEDNDLLDYTPDSMEPAPADMVNEKIMQEHVQDMLNTLPAREAKILRLRYGLADGKTHSLGEIGRKMGITRERVRQIEAQAFRRLRQPKLRRLLQDYLNN